MRNMLSAVSVLLATLIALPQVNPSDHAPPVAQCQADMRLWLEQVSDYSGALIDHVQKGTPNNSDISRLQIPQLAKRIVEMGECGAVDPPNLSAYQDVESELESARKDRYEQFVVRHKLESQLLREDAAGIR